MNASTPIANLVRSMLADGVEHDAIVHAVEAAEINLRSARKGSASEIRGTRLPEYWAPSKACIAYAASRGVAPARIAVEAEKFKNYWTAKPATAPSSATGSRPGEIGS